MQPIIMDETAAPARAKPAFWALDYMRQIRSRNVGETFGARALALLDTIALEWDRRRYEREPDFYNDQLCRTIGIVRWESLNAIRQQLQDAGYLLYRAGGKGRPAVYTPMLPQGNEVNQDSEVSGQTVSLSKNGGANEVAHSSAEAVSCSEPVISLPEIGGESTVSLSKNGVENTVCTSEIRYEQCTGTEDFLSKNGGAISVSLSKNGGENSICTSEISELYTPPLPSSSSSPPFDDRKKKKLFQSENEWQDLERQLRAFGVIDTSPLAKAQSAGCDPQHVRAIINFATANRTRWREADAPGALHKRLSLATPGLSPDAGWPHFRSGTGGTSKTPQELEEARELAAQRDREYDQANYAKKLKADQERSEREAKFGAILDSLSADELDRLAAFALPFEAALSLWRKKGCPRDDHNRGQFLRALEKQKSESRQPEGEMA